MQPVTLGDLDCAARVLLATPRRARARVMAALIDRAETADRHRRDHGRLHPVWGNGTLMAAALAQPRCDPAAPGDADYLRCLACALRAVRDRLAGRGPYP